MIIKKDTVWGHGSVIKLKGDVQIAPNATLTIEAGVKVIGGSITAFGGLEIDGTESRRVVFKDTTIGSGSVSYSETSKIRGSNFNMEGGAFIPTWASDKANFQIDHALFSGVSDFYIWYPYGESYIKNSIFDASDGLAIGVDDARVLISENLFLPPHDTHHGEASVVVWGNYGEESDISLIRNNFVVDRGGAAIEIAREFSSPKLHAEGNYFGTSDTRKIEKYVLDKRDSFERFSKIDTSTSSMEENSQVPKADDFDFSIQRGSSNSEKITGDGGNNWLFGRGGDDRLVGKGGHDFLEGGGGSDRLVGQRGNDAVYGGRGSDTLLGQAGNDQINGGAGKDNIIGGSGRDKIYGGAGADTIISGKGADQVSGGRGSDQFIYRTLSDLNGDAILDFNGMRGDRIDVSGIDTPRRAVEDDGFVLIGQEEFSGTAGEIRHEITEGKHVVSGDVNGNGVADFSFDLHANHELHSDHFHF